MSLMVRTFAVTSSPVVPSPRVAARTSRPSILQRDAEAVDLQFGDVWNRAFEVLEPAPQPLVERLQLIFVVRVVQAEHWLSVADGRKAVSRPAADALRRGIDGNEVGVIALEILELAQQRIELGVGDFRRGLDVIALFVMANLS